MCENCLKAPTNLQSMQSKVTKKSVASFQTSGESNNWSEQMLILKIQNWLDAKSWSQDINKIWIDFTNCTRTTEKAILVTT